MGFSVLLYSVRATGCCGHFHFKSLVFLFKYKDDLYSLVDKEVLAVELILVGVCAVVRTIYGGKGRVKRSISLGRGE